MSKADRSAELELRNRDSEARLGHLDSIVGFHLRMAHAAAYRDFSSRMRTIDLSQSQYAVLSLIRENPGVSQIDLARALGSDRATLMALVNRLELRRLVERKPSALDRRKQELWLCEDGFKILQRADRIIARHEQTTFCCLSPEEKSAFVNALKKIYGNLS